ncbi:MAG: cytochrome c-type biogenesis protein [Pseudomonadota bacterium]
MSVLSRRLCFGFLLFVHATIAVALSEPQEARYQAWINQLRCLVCQNQTIADSNAPLAADLREQVRSQIEAGRSDDEIRSYVTARYGDFVLYNPPLKSSTGMLWIAPFVLLVLALGFVLRRLLRRSSSS